MQILTFIAQLYATANNLSNTYDDLVIWVIDKLHSLTNMNPASAVEKQIVKLADIDPAEIRRLVESSLEKSGKPKRSRADAEVLIQILENFTRNLRTRTQSGGTGRGVLRENQLRSLLQRCGEPPKRHCHEPVTRGSAWKLRRHLGTGGFGEVWLAENPEFPAPRAYKFFTDADSIEWFRREQDGLVKVFERLRGHPHIVEFQDAQSSQCDHPFLAFEYLAGGSLDDWIQDRRGDRPVVDPGEIIRQVVAGLAAAHEKHIAHNDIKPANLLLTRGPEVRVKIGDFGLARADSRSREASQPLLSFTEQAGTPLYLPPDRGQRGVSRGPFQNDVFALGVVWYQLLIDRIERPPYDFAVRLGARGVDSHTVNLVERCLAHPERRFIDARAVAVALHETIPPPVPCPPGTPDVQHIAREYLAAMLRP